MDDQTLAGADPAWIERTLERCERRYLGAQGLMVTELSSRGEITNAEPIIADFGDILPFLIHFGRDAFVSQQLRLARPLLMGGLYAQDGRVRLFSNHDWLLGLLELHRMTGEPELLQAAAEAGKSLISSFFVGDLLVDERLVLADPRTWPAPASPFNGGYIELWLELYEATGEAAFLDASRRLANGWASSATFKRHGVFARRLSARSRLLDDLLQPLSALRARLFKDNTNLLWSLSTLYQVTGEPRWLEVIDRWLEGFEQRFLNEGDVHLWLDRNFQGRDPSLKAAFATIDLLCDLKIDHDHPRVLPLARRIADRWLEHQWSNGLFPEVPGGDRDHLDANVDMAVALTKLSALTGHAAYLEAAVRVASGVIAHHETELGLVLAVDSRGAVVSDRIIVKYQSLALKLALTPTSPSRLLADKGLLALLRDR